MADDKRVKFSNSVQGSMLNKGAGTKDNLSKDSKESMLNDSAEIISVDDEAKMLIGDADSLSSGHEIRNVNANSDMNNLKDPLVNENELSKGGSRNMDVSAVEYFICGGCGGLMAVLLGHPFDTIKVRLQTDRRYKNTWQCVMDTFQRDGPKGFYRGMSAPLCVMVPIFALSFMGFKMGKQLLNDILEIEDKDHRLEHVAVAGGFSGIVTTVIMAPGERVKCMLQTAEQNMTAKERLRKKIGPGAIIKTLYADDGLRALYRGSCATLLRDVPGTAIYFATYELLMRWSISTSGIDPCSYKTHLFTMFAGGCAGMAMWIAALPADVLKSRVQTAPTGTYPYGVRSAFMAMMRKEGPMALYSGLIPVMLRAFPANAGAFLGFELTRALIFKIKGVKPCD